MAKHNFGRSLALVLAHEGGYVDHPRDPGGATNLGITIGTLRQYVPGATVADLRAIPRDLVARIYRDGYWDKVRGDDLPAGLDYVTFDAAVNSGPARGARWTQAALNVPADGEVGTKTVAAARAADVPAVIRRATDLRLGFVRSLRTWSTFGRGWSRRIGEVRAKGLAMAGQPRNEIVGEADRIRAGARRAEGAAVVSAGSGGVAAAPAVDPAGVDWTALAQIGAGLALVVLAVVLIARARARSELAEGMRRVLNQVEV